MVFKVNKISGFFTMDREVRIYTLDGEIFYFSNNRKVTKFNLPKGVYKTDNNIKLNIKPFSFKVKKLPPFERCLKRPKKIKLFFQPNPNKCTVRLNEGIIIMDTAIKELPKPCIMFVLGHELGHYYYKSENKCDNYSFNLLLKQGYNPSQLIWASELTLNSVFRKGENLERAHTCKLIK